HFVWMNGLESGAINRHIYYNAIDTEGIQLWPSIGTPVESSLKAGYTNVAEAINGIAFSAFHQQTTNTRYHTAVGADFMPHQGAFLVYEPDWLYETTPAGYMDLKIIWPRIQVSQDETFHLFCQHNPSPDLTASNGVPKRQFYTAGTYNPLTYAVDFPPAPDTWTMVDYSQTIAYDMDASPVSDRMAFAWTYCLAEGYPGPDPLQYVATFSQLDNDINVMIDDDGQDFHFENKFNLTQFNVPNPAWLPDTVLADMDTLRAYTDMSVLIDYNDYVHIAFTTRSFFALEGTSYWHPSIVWHWSEEFPGEFQAIHYAFDDWWWNYTDCGGWNVKAQRPSLGVDPETGYLYCSYQVYDCDTLAISAGGYPSSDVFVSMSMDGGLNWAEGINVTNTQTPTSAPPGQCWSELYPTMAEKVDGECHILYVLDRDAGSIVQTEGAWTLNEVKYHSVPVDDIPSTPLVPQWPDPGSYNIHVAHGSYVGLPGAGRYDQAYTFSLDQNYPNPFNPTTNITFTLDEISDVTLKVYDLLGKEVATVTNGAYGTGQHTVTFDASNLASGVYIYKIEAGERSLARKMLIVK
ncbi:T9SS type A sorting domain-containing protein, partial [bacterium]|nr:T9SS type A sorting domain-containing protein [bacterium]